MCARIISPAMTLALASVLAALSPVTMNAQVYREKILHTFSGAPDGAGPQGGLVRDAQGNLYGVTQSGGTGTASNCISSSCGTVFKIDSSGAETILYNFPGGTDGANPGQETLVMDAQSNLFGTTLNGGETEAGSGGAGIVFKMDSAGDETVLFRFAAGLGGGPGRRRDPRFAGKPVRGHTKRGQQCMPD